MFLLKQPNFPIINPYLCINVWLCYNIYIFFTNYKNRNHTRPIITVRRPLGQRPCCRVSFIFKGRGKEKKIQFISFQGYLRLSECNETDVNSSRYPLPQKRTYGTRPGCIEHLMRTEVYSIDITRNNSVMFLCNWKVDRINNAATSVLGARMPTLECDTQWKGTPDGQRSGFFPVLVRGTMQLCNRLSQNKISFFYGISNCMGYLMKTFLLL